MNRRQNLLLCCIIFLLLSACSLTTPDPTAIPPVPTHPPTAMPPSSTTIPPTNPPIEPTPVPISPNPTATPAEPTTAPLANPLDLVSQETLFAYLEDLTAIQAYSGWRNSASTGEAEAIDYVTTKLEEMAYLQQLGLEFERQDFHVFLSTDIWESRVQLTVGDQEIEVPADALRSHRDDTTVALRYDSDGVLNDSEPNPALVEARPVLLRSLTDINTADLENHIALLDYAVINTVLQGGPSQGAANASALLRKNPAGIILVTENSVHLGGSHGFILGDGAAFRYVDTALPAPPILYVRLEDLGPAGISSWDDLAQIDSIRMTWDADVFSPGTSGNLVARIPGADSSKALILSAHIDSPNNPGAMDDGSGSVVLLEVARTLNEAHYQPAVDLYLVWYGSEELVLYGSAHFANTHQELLDRSLALLQIDCLTRPLDGIQAQLHLIGWSYARLGDDRLPWADHLARLAREQGIHTEILDAPNLTSDNNSLDGYNVPNVDLVYTNEEAMYATGSWHYAAHVHDPYDTVELTRDVADILEQMARVSVAAAVYTTAETPNLRTAPEAGRRVVFVASHTESIHMTPATFNELGMAIAAAGLDLDLIPYGQAVTAADLEGAAMVVVLPVLDYPNPEGDVGLYDESWTEQEIAALESYVEQGGLLVLTNSANRLKYYNRRYDPNEDWADMNALAGRFGITYLEGYIDGRQAWTTGEHPLVEGVAILNLAEDNGVPLQVKTGQVLVEGSGGPVLALVDYGNAGGQVLALAGVGILSNAGGNPPNLPFWNNLAQYALDR